MVVNVKWKNEAQFKRKLNQIRQVAILAAMEGLEYAAESVTIRANENLIAGGYVSIPSPDRNYEVYKHPERWRDISILEGWRIEQPKFEGTKIKIGVTNESKHAAAQEYGTFGVIKPTEGDYLYFDSLDGTVKKVPFVRGQQRHKGFLGSALNGFPTSDDRRKTVDVIASYMKSHITPAGT